MGVKEKQITTIGLGRSQDCFLRVKDTNKQGFLIEELARLNRAVFVFDYDSVEAKQILNMK